MTKDAKPAADSAPAPKNTATLVAGFITELVKVEDEIERDTEKHIKPLTS